MQIASQAPKNKTERKNRTKQTSVHGPVHRERERVIMNVSQDDFYLCFIPSHEYVNKKTRGIYQLDFLKGLKVKNPP
jgi:hypothetical protein